MRKKKKQNNLSEVGSGKHGKDDALPIILKLSLNWNGIAIVVITA